MRTALASVITRLRALDPTAAERLVLEHATTAARREAAKSAAQTLGSQAARGTTGDEAFVGEGLREGTRAVSTPGSSAVDQPAFSSAEVGAELALSH